MSPLQRSITGVSRASGSGALPRIAVTADCSGRPRGSECARCRPRPGLPGLGTVEPRSVLRVTELAGVGVVESWVVLTLRDRAFGELPLDLGVLQRGSADTNSTMRFRERDEAEAAANWLDLHLP